MHKPSLKLDANVTLNADKAKNQLVKHFIKSNLPSTGQRDLFGNY